jgi:Flp pilus assembly secretin CpaC
MKFTFLKLFLAQIHFVHLLAAPQTYKPTLILGQGEQRLLRIPGLVRYSLGGSSIRAMHPPKTFKTAPGAQKETLLIKGIAAGMSDLWVWKTDGTTEHRAIRVERLKAEDRNPALERALEKLREVEVLYSGRGTILRGKITSLEESASVAALLQVFPKEIHDETEPSEELLAEAQRQLNRWLQSSGYSTKLRIEKRGQALWLRGNIDRPSEVSSIRKQSRALFPLIQTDVEALPDQAPTIYFRVFLLELRRNEFQSLGLAWPGSIMGAFQVTTGAIHDLLQIDLALQQLEGKGSARILSNPELVVRAPGEAELFAGGELPIQTQSRYYSNVSWKNYGLTLRLKVTHSTGDRVRLDIFTEVSHLDQHHGSSDHLPAIQSNRMKTQVDARFGTPLLLSGLLQQGTREEAKGLPFLRGIPVLGKLFGSEDYLNERSELVAILYPHSAPPDAPMDKIHGLTPKGFIPPPRDWISPQEERALRASPEFPWNALQ